MEYKANMEAAQLSAEELMAQVASERDRRAFTALFQLYTPRLRGFFVRGGATDEVADELIQEVMLRIWRHAGHYSPERGRADTWVFRIARNVRSDRAGRYKRYQLEPSDPALVPPAPETPEELAQRRRSAHTVREALAALPPEQADILRAVYFGAKSMQAVADEQSLPLGTVKSRVRLGFKRLREVLAP